MISPSKIFLVVLASTLTTAAPGNSGWGNGGRNNGGQGWGNGGNNWNGANGGSGNWGGNNRGNGGNDWGNGWGWSNRQTCSTSVWNIPSIWSNPVTSVETISTGYTSTGTDFVPITTETTIPGSIVTGTSMITITTTAWSTTVFPTVVTTDITSSSAYDTTIEQPSVWESTGDPVTTQVVGSSAASTWETWVPTIVYSTCVSYQTSSSGNPTTSVYCPGGAGGTGNSW